MSISNSAIPGPESLRLARRLARVESQNITYASRDFPVFWESARGAYVRDADGNRFLDLTSAFGVSSLGHSSPVLRRAILKQVAQMWHGMGDVHPNRVKVELLERLATLAPRGLSVGILGLSGADAVESALKTARLFTGRAGVIAFEGAYHGLTLGTLPVTHRRDFREPFCDQWRRTAVHLPFPDPLRRRSEAEVLAAVKRALKNGKSAREFGAIVIEPVQGRGGVRIASREFLKGLRSLATAHGALLIVDEVFTGLGRTGRRFAIDHSGVMPDLLCLGKALANGYPISVCLGSTRVMKAWPNSDGEAIHTSTFLGNPLGCAMALASLGELERARLARRADRLGAQWLTALKKALQDHPRVAEVRGQGLMIGIELVKDRTSMRPNSEAAIQAMNLCLKRGLIVLVAGNDRQVLSLTPPLTIAQSDLVRSTRILKEVIDGLR